MRVVLLMIIAAPAFMALRTFGLLRDWLVLRHWARRRTAAATAPPVLNDPFDVGGAPAAAEAYARRKFILSALTTTAAACFALAAALTLVALFG